MILHYGKSTQKIKQLLLALNKPYEDQENISDYKLPAPSSNKKYQTFCGTWKLNGKCIQPVTIYFKPDCKT